jgi:hypothetical protein
VGSIQTLELTNLSSTTAEVDVVFYHEARETSLHRIWPGLCIWRDFAQFTFEIAPAQSRFRDENHSTWFHIWIKTSRPKFNQLVAIAKSLYDHLC